MYIPVWDTEKLFLAVCIWDYGGAWFHPHNLKQTKSWGILIMREDQRSQELGPWKDPWPEEVTIAFNNNLLSYSLHTVWFTLLKNPIQ